MPPSDDGTVTLPTTVLLNALINAVNFAAEAQQLRQTVVQVTHERDAIFAQLAGASAPGITPPEPAPPINFMAAMQEKYGGKGPKA